MPKGENGLATTPYACGNGVPGVRRMAQRRNAAAQHQVFEAKLNFSIARNRIRAL